MTTYPLDLSLYLILDPEHCVHHHPLKVLDQALEGGVSIVQFRDKNASYNKALQLAKPCCQLCHAHNVPFLINDNPFLARDVGADGCHLGQNDTHPKIARNILPHHAIIGRTAHSREELLALQDDTKNNLCHYIGIGPLFPSSSKKHKNPHFIGTKGLESFIQYAHHLFSPSFPLCAISGINLQNAPSVIATPIHGIAVISAICSAPQPLFATKILRQLIDDQPLERISS